MNVYVDASVVLRRLLKQPQAILRWSDWGKAVTSELLRVEACRTLDRLRVRGKLSDSELAERLAALRDLMSRFDEAPLQPSVLQRAAAAFPTALGTLDAIHLATALLWVESRAEPLVFLTHDMELAVAARACGLDVKTSP